MLSCCLRRDKFTLVRKYKGLLIFNFLMIVFIFSMIWIKPIDFFKVYEINRQQGNASGTFLVYDNESASQTFICMKEADSIEIPISVANKSYHGSFLVELFDEKERIQSWERDKLDVSSEWLDFYLTDGKILPYKEYRIAISAPELDKANAIVLTYGSERKEYLDEDHPVYKDGVFEINGESQETSLRFAVYTKKTNVLAIAAILIVVAVANLWWINRYKSINEIAIWILISCGVVMLLVMAPSSGPDDPYHYYSAFELSNVIMGRENAGEVEFNYRVILSAHNNANSSYVLETNNFLEPVPAGEKKILFEFNEHKDRLYGPISHLAPAIGITIGRLFNANFIQLYTLARVFNMISYIIMAYIAVRLMPKNKELLLLICIIPMQMHQAAQCTYDVIVNGMTLIYASYIMKIIHDQGSFTWRKALTCLLILAIFAPVKTIYIIISLLILAIPQSMFISRKDRFIKLFVVFLGTIAVMVIANWDNLYARIRGETIRIITDRYTLDFVFKHPLEYAKLVISSLETQTWGLITSSVGNSLAGATIGIPEYYIITYIVIMLLCALGKREEKPLLDKKQKYIFAGTAILGVFVVMAVFVFVYTDYGASSVSGVQGRYLLPFMAPLMFCLSGMKIYTDIDRRFFFYPVWFIELGYIITIMSQVKYGM